MRAGMRSGATRLKKRPRSKENLSLPAALWRILRKGLKRLSCSKKSIPEHPSLRGFSTKGACEAKNRYTHTSGPVFALAAALFIFLVQLFSQSLYAEAVFGGTGDISAATLVQNDTPGQSPLFPTVRFSPAVQVWADSYELSVAVEAESDFITEPSLRLTEFRLSAYPGENLTVKTGVFQYLPGSSEFFSPTNYFSRTDLEKLVTASAGGWDVPTLLFQAGAYGDELYLLYTLSPIRPEPLLIDTASPWFPGGGIPKSFTIPFFNKTLTLGKTSYAEDAQEAWKLGDMSWQLEGGLTTGLFDFSLLFYNGWDTSPLYTLGIEYSDGMTGTTYDILLTPHITRYKALGFDLTSTIGAFRLWMEGSFNMKRAYISGKLTSALDEGLALSDSFAFTAGMSWESTGRILTALIEYSDLSIDHETLTKPMLSHALAAALRISLSDDRLVFTLSNILSLKDYSDALVPIIEYSPSDQLTLRAHAPFFFGEDKAELGQFRDNHYVSLSLIFRF